jgi:hypothetical protein
VRRKNNQKLKDETMSYQSVNPYNRKALKTFKELTD